MYMYADSPFESMSLGIRFRVGLMTVVQTPRPSDLR